MAVNQTDDTIIALSTASGRAALAVVRLSGSAACDVLSAMTKGALPAVRQASLRSVHDPLGRLIDQALVTRFAAPASFTGQDMVEISLHGGTAVVDACLTAALETGLCRLALPGEFTRRAFEAGKIDLTRAEAIADLIDAETESQRLLALEQFSGTLERAYDRWRDQLVDILACLEAAVDFPDEADVPLNVDEGAFSQVERLKGELRRVLERARRGQGIREGFSVAIIGRPNAGKSSLINTIAGREAAIVSEIPGTTRDIVEVREILNGYVVWIADTAGLRESADAVEAEGVRRALARADGADLRVGVVDITEPLPEDVLGALRPGDILAVNKADLRADPTSMDAMGVSDGLTRLTVSARSGEGVSALVGAIGARASERLSGQEPVLVTRKRHEDLLVSALEHLERAQVSIRSGPELAAEDVRLAARALGQVTGKVDIEEVLGAIFSRFCIGK